MLLALAPLSSCRRAVEKARKNIRIEAVEKVERQGLTGAEVVVRVMNDTGHKLQLDQVRLEIYYATDKVATILLREPVEVQRRTVGSLSTRWILKISDPLALYVLVRKIDSGEIGQVAVSYSVAGRGGPMPVNISRQMMPLSDFLNIFGVTLEEVKNYLKK